MSISGFFQLIIGFLLGSTLFAAGVAGGLYLFFGGMSQSPAKPVFSEEKPAVVTDNKPLSTQENGDKTNNTMETEKPNPVESEKLPEGAYLARVIWKEGLKLRAEPSKDAERVGGVEYNWELIILSENGEWQKVRIPSSGQEGWIKAGNVEKIN